MKDPGKIILRIHGLGLIFITIVLTIFGGLSMYLGTGPYGDMLKKDPIGYIGLFQAYLLMTVLGIVVLIGSRLETTRIWHIIGILAHTPPLVANILFWNEIESYGITHAGVIIHLVFMSLETIGYNSYKN